MFEIRVDNQTIKRFERQLAGIPRALPRAMSRGLNRTATEARTKIGRTIAQRSGVRVADVKKGLFLQRANYGNWRSAVTVSQKRLSLRLLNPRQTQRGLSVKHGRKRVTIRHAFPALKGWFIRLPSAGGYKTNIGVAEALEIDSQPKVGRMPIARIHGPRLSQIYREADAETARIFRESMDRLQKNIHDQVQLILSRRAG